MSNHPDVSPPPAAIVRTITREDVLWNRRIFKAPPLKVKPPVVDLALATRFEPAQRGAPAGSLR
jgi:hypothetical protein